MICIDHLINPIMHKTIPTMPQFVAEMCTHLHISATKWGIVGYGSSALWDLCSRFIAPCIKIYNITRNTNLSFAGIIRNIPGKLDYYHGSWCLGSLHLQVISKCGIGYIVQQVISLHDDGFELPLSRQSWHMLNKYLTTPSHYLNQCWIITSEIQWLWFETIPKSINQWNLAWKLFI